MPRPGTVSPTAYYKVGNLVPAEGLARRAVQMGSASAVPLVDKLQKMLAMDQKTPAPEEKPVEEPRHAPKAAEIKSAAEEPSFNEVPPLPPLR